MLRKPVGPMGTVKEVSVDLKIINGTVVTASDCYKAQVGVENGKVVQHRQEDSGARPGAPSTPRACM
jgi:urease alpha subunit